MDFGRYQRRIKVKGDHQPHGWFFSAWEVETATAEYERRISNDPKKRYYREYERLRRAGRPTRGVLAPPSESEEARRARTRTSRQDRAESCFRAELADPLSHRTPSEAWAYACGIFDYAGPMPAVDVQRASRDALLVASATSRNIDRREAYRSCAPTGTVRPA